MTDDPFFFGYGSLVNRHTHGHDDHYRAAVAGWRRVWRHSNTREVAFLSVHEAPGHSIAGLIAAVPDGDWAALDRREHAYDRVMLTHTALQHDHPARPEIHMYRARAAQVATPSIRHPVLLSYLDTVIAGFVDIFGAKGADGFFETTDGWDCPILDDREAPIYPRATRPGRAITDMVDLATRDLGAEVFRR